MLAEPHYTVFEDEYLLSGCCESGGYKEIASSKADARKDGMTTETERRNETNNSRTLSPTHSGVIPSLSNILRVHREPTSECHVPCPISPITGGCLYRKAVQEKIRLTHAPHPVPAVRQDPASASVFAAMLENSVTQNPLDEWLRSPSRDIHTRLVHFSSPVDGPAPTASYSSSPPYSRTIRSSSSMAPALVHQSNASTHPPSLYNYSDATPTETSVSTGLASRLSGVPLLEDVNGVLERRPTAYRTPMYECVFWFLNCQYASHSQEEWNVHCLSHFRGEEPPRSVQCPLCEFAGTCDDGWTAWNARMEHIAVCHAMLGETLKRSRPDFHLFTHLWQKRLIDDQDLKELKSGNHNLTRAPDNFVSTGGGRRDRNAPRRRAQHVGRGPYGGRTGPQ